MSESLEQEKSSSDCRSGNKSDKGLSDKNMSEKRGEATKKDPSTNEIINPADKFMAPVSQVSLTEEATEKSTQGSTASRKVSKRKSNWEGKEETPSSALLDDHDMEATSDTESHTSSLPVSPPMPSHRTHTEDHATTPGAVAINFRRAQSSFSSTVSQSTMEQFASITRPQPPIPTISTEVVDFNRAEILQSEVERLREVVLRRSKIQVIRVEPLPLVPFGENASEHSTQPQNNFAAARCKTWGLSVLFFFTAVVVGVIAGTLVGGKSHNTARKPTNNAFDIISGIPQLSRMQDGIKFTGISDQLLNETRDPVSILAPTNEAFEKYIDTDREAIIFTEPRGVVHLRELLRKHILHGANSD